LKIDGLTGYGSAANPRASGIGAQAVTAQNNRHEKVNRIAGIACSFHKFLICKNITSSYFFSNKEPTGFACLTSYFRIMDLKI
jgi:hypothetical protein